MMLIIDRVFPPIRAACVVAIIVPLAGCGAAHGGSSGAIVRDSAGIAIVENRWADSADVAWWSIESPPLADIGGADAGEAYALYQVGGAARLTDGRIVVSNGGSADIRFFTADGAYIRTSGRRGGGPGEFQHPGPLFVTAGDTLLITDAFARRISVLDPQGAFVRELTTTKVTATSFFSPTKRFDDGTLLGTQSFSPDINSDQAQRPDLFLVTLSPAGRQDTVLKVPGSEMRLSIQRDASGGIGAFSILRPPFPKSTRYAITNDGIYVGTEDAPEIRLYGRDGSLRRIIRTGLPRRPVTQADIDAWVDFEVKDLDPPLQNQRRDALLADRPAKVVPPYGSIETDSQGDLWVADYDTRVEPRGRWTVYDAGGRAIARIQLPPGIRVQEIGAEYLLGIERDELDVQHVRLYRLNKSS